jgi:hypothetical protein
LFSEPPKTSEAKKITAPSIFDSGTDLFGSSPSASDLFGTPKKSSLSTGAALPPAAKSSLFGDDEFSSLFSAPAPAKQKSAPAPAPAPAVKAVAEEPSVAAPEVEEAPVAVVAEEPAPAARKKPVGGVSLFGGADLFGSSPPSAGKSRPAPPKTSPAPAAASGGGLFGDDEEIAAKPVAAPAVAAPAAVKKTSASLFGDDDPLFGSSSSSSSTKKSTSLFGDSGKADDLFSVKPAVVVTKKASPVKAPAESVAASPAKKEAFTDPLAGSPKKKNIAALGANINFNPAMLLGGGRPPPKEAPATEAHLNEAGDLVLENESKRLVDEASSGQKSKATLRRKGAKKRAPTRRRKAADDEWDVSDDEEENKPISTTDGIPSVAEAVVVDETPAAVSAPIIASDVSAPISASATGGDIFGESAGDIFGDASASTADIFTTPATTATAPDIFGNLGDAPDIF